MSLQKLAVKVFRHRAKLVHDQVCTLTTVIEKSAQLKSFQQIPSKKIPLIPQSFNLLLSGGPGYLHQHFHKLHHELGPIVRQQYGPSEMVFLADTRLIQQVIANEGQYPHHNVPEPWLFYNKLKNTRRGLFFQMGEPWLKLRRAFNKVMLINSDHFGHDIWKISNQLLDIWQAKQQDRDGRIELNNVKTELCKWSIETTGFVLFGNRLDCISGNLSDTSRPERLVESVAQMFEETSRLQLMPCKLAHRLNLPAWRRFEHATDEMLNLANEYASKFIGMAKNNDKQRSIVKGLLGLSEPLTDDEITRSMVDLIIAAADTTSNALQWALYCIAKHQNVQEKLLAEIEASPSTADQSDLKRPYLSAFLREVSRLYPTAPFLARTLESDIVLDNYHVPANTTIVFSLYTTSRMEQYFDDPLEFKPERWLRNSQTKSMIQSHSRKAYASLPFGIGARMCVGRRVAELEMSLFVTAFVKRFECNLANNLKDDVGIKLKLILTPDKPISLLLKQR